MAGMKTPWVPDNLVRWCQPVAGVVLGLSLALSVSAAGTAKSSFRVELSPPPFPDALLTNSPFGINTAFSPDTPDLEARLKALQEIGVKWGRQDFIWRRIERMPGEYDWEPYERLTRRCRERGVSLFGCLAYAPPFHDPRTVEGAEAYARFAAAAARRFRGQIEHWQIWNEPNGGFWQGSPEEYARLLTLAGQAIHDAQPAAKVLGLNMAFCDVLWAQKIFRLVPWDAFDIVCFHPYRPPSAPEEPFDWWVLDQYVKSWHRGVLREDYEMVRMPFLEQTDLLIAAMRRFGEPKPLWVTEICWNSHVHPYGTSELRQADLLVRFHVLALASRKIEKVCWWTLKDGGQRQFDQADMVGLARAELSPKYAWYAFATMTRQLEGKRWVRNDAFGPEVFACVFHDPEKKEDTLVAWSTRPYAYLRVNNTEEGLTLLDIYGTRRFIEYDEVRTRGLSVPIGESPIYIVAPEGLRASVRPDPGW
jgi:hypothetical protein